MIGIIPAAGKGTRFKELGKLYSKTILPYKGKPLLIHQIEYMEKHGVSDIRVVLGHQAEETEHILKIYDKHPEIVIQKEQVGLSHAVYCALKETDKDSVLIILGDILPQDNLTFEESFISYQVVPDFSRWCMAKTKPDSFMLDVLLDKPQEDPNTNKALSGIYFFKKSNLLRSLIHTQLDKNERIAKEFQISTAISQYNEQYPIVLKEIGIRDFGTLEEYLANRDVSISRSFNQINEKDDVFIVKSSLAKPQKILDEYNWFNSLPSEMKRFIPKMYDFSIIENKIGKPFGAQYTMEKIFAPTLRELFLFLDSSYETWCEIYVSIAKFLQRESKYRLSNDFLKLVYDKTESRIKQLPEKYQNNMDVNEFMSMFKDEIDKFVYEDYSLMHGDFCFSNIFYDFTKKQICVIDPRGQTFGSKYYEYAKLMHSAIYDYDFIDAELYIKTDTETVIYNNGKDGARKAFNEFIEASLSKEEINFVRLICASLFLSMIPLHSHNKTNQELYFKTFKRAFKDYKNAR